MDDRNDFGDRQPLAGHCAVRLDIPENLPAKFRRPAQYILATVRRSFKILHAFFYERCVVLIAPDSLDNRIRQFTAELLATMTQTTKTFRLRAVGLAALSRPLVAELVSPLGEIIELKMNSTTSDDYADTATIIVRQSVSWNCPKALPFRAYGLDLEAKLSVTPENTERPPRVQRHEAKRDALAGDQDAGWQVVKRRPKVTKSELCRDFARGVCGHGAKCFRHSKEACRDAARGHCTRTVCKYVHPPPELASSSVMTPPRAAILVAPSSPDALSHGGHYVQRRAGRAGHEQDDDMSDEEVAEDAQDFIVCGDKSDASMPLHNTSRNPAPAHRRSRSPSPQPGAPREVWTKALRSNPLVPPPNKKRDKRSSKPSSPAMAPPTSLPETSALPLEARGSQQLQAAPPEGAGPEAP